MSLTIRRARADEAGLVVEGLSFHVGSQTTNFENYVQALQMAAGIFDEAALRQAVSDRITAWGLADEPKLREFVNAG